MPDHVVGLLPPGNSIVDFHDNLLNGIEFCLHQQVGFRAFNVYQQGICRMLSNGLFKGQGWNSNRFDGALPCKQRRAPEVFVDMKTQYKETAQGGLAITVPIAATVVDC